MATDEYGIRTDGVVTLAAGDPQAAIVPSPPPSSSVNSFSALGSSLSNAFAVGIVAVVTAAVYATERTHYSDPWL